MPVRPYEDTSLWKATLGGAKRGAHSQLKQELAQAYRKFRERAAELTNDIHGQLPNLTVHNVEHLDALWDVASIIAGEKYPLNPLEAFVLGGAILIHDAGMVLAAFDGGLDEVKKNDRWRDNLLAALKRHGIEEPTETDFEKPPRDAEHEAIFDVLRQVHSDKAKDLHKKVWHNPGSGYGQRLIDDTRLLEDYGELIGLIAASHHWDVNSLTRKLPSDPIAPSNPYPREWTVDAIKVACLLRCADAANIDESRAPSFIYAMRRPDKISKQHWHFQNRLRPARLEKDALVFRSKTAFRYPSDATEGKDFETQAWWLCHDAIQEVERQLSLSDALLRDTGRRPFAARRVAGADAPDRLTSYIEVEGWRPVDTSVKVTDVVHLVEMLGGKQLYGDDPIVPLRELMQNAADAIRARRVVDPNFEKGKPEHERGCIHVEVRDDPDDEDRIWLIVEDDGVGMSERVLTGPLLDFGKSFWRSPMSAELFPGLSSSHKFRPAGRFGIGFYSIFMYADIVRVTSRPLEAKLSSWGEIKTLEFSHGLARRALLRAHSPIQDGHVGMSVATRVAVRLPSEMYLKWHDHPFFGKGSWVPFADQISALNSLAERMASLVMGLECRVSLCDKGKETFVHAGTWRNMSNSSFLRDLYCLSTQSSNELFDEFIRHAEFVSEVEAAGAIFGRAAARGGKYTDGWSAYSIGGFTVFEDGYHVGLLMAEPETAARTNISTSLRPALAHWVESQIELYRRSNADPEIKSTVASTLTRSPFDVSALMHARRHSGKYVGFEELVEFLHSSGRLRFVGFVTTKGGGELLGVDAMVSIEGEPLRVPVGEIDVDEELYFGGFFLDYFRIENASAISCSHQSLFTAIRDAAQKLGRTVALRVQEDTVIGLYDGKRVLADVFEISIVDSI